MTVDNHFKIRPSNTHDIPLLKGMNPQGKTITN